MNSQLWALLPVGALIANSIRRRTSAIVHRVGLQAADRPLGLHGLFEGH